MMFEFSVQDQRWDQRGRDLNDVAGHDDFGIDSIAMSKNGDVVAVGEKWHELNGMENVGHVLVFEYSAVDSGGIFNIHNNNNYSSTPAYCRLHKDQSQPLLTH